MLEDPGYLCMSPLHKGLCKGLARGVPEGA